MLLQRIVLDHFRQFDQQEYEFQPGLNLIKGPNEAGKTTLQEGIFFALLGNPRRTTLGKRRDRGGQRPTKRVDDYISWGEHSRFRVTLELTDKSGSAYRLTKDWGARALCLTDLKTGEEEEDIDSVQQTINDMLGYGSMELVQSTVCVEQDAIDDISAGRREIGDQLQSIFTGGGIDEATVSAVLADLDGKIAEMKRGWRTHAPVNPGPIRVKQDEIAALEERLSRIRPQVGLVEEAKEQLIALEARIEGIERELALKRSLKELCDRCLDLEKQRDAWRSREKPLEIKIEQIEEATKQIEQVNEALRAYPRFDAVDSEVEQELANLYQRAKVLQEEIERRSAELKQLETKQPTEARSKAGVPIMPLVGAGAGFLLLVMGVALGLTLSLPVGLLVGLLGLLMGIGCTIWLVVVLSRPRPLDLSSQIAARETELEQSQRHRLDVLTQLTEGLAPFGCATWDEFSQRLPEYRALLNQQEKAEARRDALLGEQTLEALIEERRTASRHRRDAEEALRDPEMQRAIEITPLQYEELKQDIKRLEDEMEGRNQERLKYQMRRDEAICTVEDVHRLEEQKAAAERSLIHLEEWFEVCQLTRDVIKEAKELTMRSARDELEPRIGAYFRRITQDRYTQVEADDDLNLRVFSQEKGDWITPESGELSRGTVDQLYLAARLALLDLLYRDAKPPLLLDDPFVKFDADRREQAMELCKEIAQDHQILFFTCHDVYDAIADCVVNL